MSDRSRIIRRVALLYPFLLAGVCILLVVKLFQKLDCPYKSHYYSLTDISEVDVPKDQSIFFIESSLVNSYERENFVLTPRIACAVESAARVHPTSNVYLLLVSPNIIKMKNDTELRIKTLLKYKNLRVNSIDLRSFMKRTPVENLYNSGQIYRSEHIRTHVSDVLRLLLLWKYGGVYIDTDVITLYPLTRLGDNFIGSESAQFVNGAVMNFKSEGVGRRFVEDCLVTLSRTFSRSSWASNGPHVLTDVSHKLCNVSSIDPDRETVCRGIKFLPYYMFFPISYGYWNYTFDAKMTTRAMKLIRYAYALHLWNYLSETINVHPDDKTTFAIVAKEKCPKIYYSSDHL